MAIIETVSFVYCTVCLLLCSFSLSLSFVCNSWTNLVLDGAQVVLSQQCMKELGWGTKNWNQVGL